MSDKVDVTIDCSSEEGITVGLIDGIVAMARILRKRDMSPEYVQEALDDIRDDEDLRWLLEEAGI